MALAVDAINGSGPNSIICSQLKPKKDYYNYRAVATGTASTAMAVPLFDQVPYKFERVIFFYNGTYHNNYVYCIRNILMKLANSAKAQLQRLNTQYFARIVLTRNKISNVLI